MSSTIKVKCNLSNGLLLHLHWPLAVAERGPVELRPGTNEIDAEFWHEWASSHADADMLVNRHIVEVT